MRGSNLASLGMIQAFRLAAGFAVNVVLMRGLGVEGFGVYGYVNILVGLASFAATMGMDRLLKREIARAPDTAGRWLATAAAATLLLGGVTGVVVAAWVLLVDGRVDVLVAALLAALAVSLQALSLVPTSYFHAIQRMRLGVPGSALGRLALVIGTLVAVLGLHAGVVGVFVAQVLDGLVTLGVSAWIFRRLEVPGLRTSFAAVRELLRVSVPFGINALFVTIYLSVDVIVLANVRGDEEVGVYRAAVMLLSLVTVLAETFTSGLFPRMSRFVDDPARAADEMGFAARILLALSVPVAVGGVLTAEPLMILLGGEAYAPAALAFAIMAPLLPLRFLSNGYGMALSALDRQNDRTTAAVVAAVFNLALIAWAIPAYGHLGAAGATLATEALLALWLYARLRPVLPGLSVTPSAVRVGAAAAAMAALLWALPGGVHVLAAVALGAAGFVGAGRLTGAWSPSDLARLRAV